MGQKSIFVVQGKYGIYSDTTTYLLGYFSTEVTAKEYAQKAFDWWKNNIQIPVDAYELDRENDWATDDLCAAFVKALQSPYGHAEHTLENGKLSDYWVPMYFYEQHDFEIIEVKNPEYKK